MRPFTVKVNCQIRGLASIRKGLGTENTPFLVSSYRRTYPEWYRVKILKASEKVFFQSGGVPILPILKGPVFAPPEGSQFCQSGGVPTLPIRRGPNFANLEGSQFCQFGGVLFSPIRRGPPICQSGRVLFLPIRRGPGFANPEGSYFCQNLSGQKKSK